MKKLGLIVALVFGGLVACSMMVNAQDAKGKGRGDRTGGGRPTVDQQLEQMATALTLTDEQKPKVKAVLEETSKKLQELFSGGNRDQAREKMTALREEQTKKMKEILTADQFAKWQKMEEERRARYSGGKGGEKGGGKKKAE